MAYVSRFRCSGQLAAFVHTGPASIGGRWSHDTELSTDLIIMPLISCCLILFFKFIRGTVALTPSLMVIWNFCRLTTIGGGHRRLVEMIDDVRSMYVQSP